MRLDSPQAELVLGLYYESLLQGGGEVYVGHITQTIQDYRDVRELGVRMLEKLVAYSKAGVEFIRPEPGDSWEFHRERHLGIFVVCSHELERRRCAAGA